VYGAESSETHEKSVAQPLANPPRGEPSPSWRETSG
jgi:hypothetical protein